jgi:hypothetical protein
VARPRGKRSRRRIFVAILTIAVSVILIAVGAPRVTNSAPQHEGTLQAPVSHIVFGGTSANPTTFALQLPGVGNNALFVLQVKSNQSASFCVMSDVLYLQWRGSSSTSQSSPFPWDGCLLKRFGTYADTLSFTPSYSGTWDVVVLNTNPTPIKVDFLPA